MIVTIKIHTCPNCGSINIVKNGKDYKGSPKYKCNNCLSYGTLEAKSRYSEEFKEMVIRAYLERMSMWGIYRTFGVHPDTLVRWLIEKSDKLPELKKTLDEARSDDILELDELWSFVLKKDNKVWIWIALCRRTRQIVAYYVGDRSDQSLKKLWESIPESYKKGSSYRDFYGAYQRILNGQSHECVGKDSGQTAHVERWNNTLRQRLARFVRKTLSFSKSEKMHKLVLGIFIIYYNLQCLPSN